VKRKNRPGLSSGFLLRCPGGRQNRFCTNLKKQETVGKDEKRPGLLGAPLQGTESREQRVVIGLDTGSLMTTNPFLGSKDLFCSDLKKYQNTIAVRSPSLKRSAHFPLRIKAEPVSCV
jgi:hypothetical protein